MSMVPPGSGSVQPADIDQSSLFPPLDIPSSQRIAQLARMHIRDFPMPFMARIMTNGVSFRYDVPVANIDVNTFQAALTTGSVSTQLVLNTDYTFDPRQGIMFFNQIPAEGQLLVTTGEYMKDFLPGELDLYVRQAYLQHTSSTNNAPQLSGQSPLPALDIWPAPVAPVMTTIAAGSNGLSLPQAVINLASTAGLAPSGTANVQTSTGNWPVTYTGVTPTTLTGASGGTGVMSTGGLVTASYGTPTLPRLPEIEEYPLSLLVAHMALWDLALEAAQEYDIRTPDAVVIPRGQRFAQLLQAAAMAEEKYKTQCSLLNVGLYAISITDLRRTSRTTNRLVPIYRSREYDERAWPQRELPQRTVGPDERVVTYQGQWANTLSYNKDDIVDEAGQRYIALTAVSPGKDPAVDVNPASGYGYYWAWTSLNSGWFGLW